MEPTVITVSLPHQSYPIVIGTAVRRRFPEYFAATGCRRAFWVTDANVAQHWQAELDALRDPNTELIILPPGEEHKRLSTIEALCRRLVALGVERGDTLVACGGGVIGDIAGFAASVYQRGIAFIQIPTTLLAMVDASVGGKTGVDLPEGKNLVGTFHQPAFVLADPDFLKTLPSRELTSGFAEVIKTALIGDVELFAELSTFTERGSDISSFPYHYIERCVRFKSNLIVEDETDKGRRAILNFGHTLGHALEAAGDYQILKHGEAVFWGMTVAVDLSTELGLLKASTVGQIIAVIQPFLPTLPRLDFTSSQLIELIHRDKKVQGGKPRFILIEDLAKPLIVDDVTETPLIAALEKLRHKMGSMRSK